MELGILAFLLALARRSDVTQRLCLEAIPFLPHPTDGVALFFAIFGRPHGTLPILCFFGPQFFIVSSIFLGHFLGGGGLKPAPIKDAHFLAFFKNPLF